MKTRRILYIIALVALASGLMPSCKGGFGKRGASEVLFDSVVAKQHIPLFLDGDTTLPYADVNVSFMYPLKFKNAKSLARLQQIFTGTFFGDVSYDSLSPQEAIVQYIDAYTHGYREIGGMYKEEKEKLGDRMPMWYWYWMQHTNKVLYQDNRLLSYAVEYSDYTGGAHGSYHIAYTNIDLKNIATLTEEDLFVPGYYKPLTEKIVQGLMHKYRVEEPDSLLMHGFFTIDDIVPNNNFWLNDEGIHYSYNQYEIAPYVMGVIDVMIPYSKLTDILIPDGIVQHYIPEGETIK